MIKDLVKRLISGENQVLSIDGLPGVGKTTLAVALAHHRKVLQHFKDGVLWAGLGRQADVMSALAAWAEALKVDISQLIDEKARQEAVRNAIGQGYFLLVIDDAWDAKAAEMLRCGGPNCCHLLSTRDKGIARAFAGAGQSRNVPPLDEGSAFVLLQKLAPEACEADPEAAWLLAEAVGGLPLALELLGGYLSAPELVLFPDLSQAALAKMTDPQRRLQLAAERLGTPGPEATFHDTVGLSLERLRESERGREAEHVFYALGAFAPKPESFSREAAEAVAETDAKTLALLAARNLVEVLKGRLVLHQTLADVARTNLDESAVARHHNYYLSLVSEDREDWQRIEAVYGQIKWAWSRLDEDKVLDWVWALRLYQQRRGLWRDYLAWSQRALSIMEEAGDRAGLAVTLSNIGGVYSKLGQQDQALVYYQRALSIMEEVGDRARLAVTLSNIGAVYDSLGQRDKALDYLQRALTITEEVGHRTGLAVTLNNIGGVYDSLGQRDKALDYYQRAMTITEEAGDRTGLAVTLNNIGLVYHSLGQQDQALVYYQRALSIQEEAGDRAYLAVTLSNIGSVYSKLGQQDQALVYYQRALSIMEEVGDRYGLARTLNNIGLVYNNLGQQDQALVYYQRALSIMEEVGDRDGLAVTLTGIGAVYDSLGQRDKALDYLQRALPITEEVGDRDGESVTRYNIAMIYRAQGLLEKAVAELKRVVELDRFVQRPDLENDLAMLAQVEAEMAAQNKKSPG